jgi:hypothetical protein
MQGGTRVAEIYVHVEIENSHLSSQHHVNSGVAPFEKKLNRTVVIHPKNLK